MILRTLQQKGAFSSVLNFPGHFFKSVPKMQEESRNTTLIKCPSQRPSESPCVPFVRGHSSFAQTQHFTSKDESSVTVSELKHTLRVGEKILFFPSWKKGVTISPADPSDNTMCLLICDTTGCSSDATQGAVNSHTTLQQEEMEGPSVVGCSVLLIWGIQEGYRQKQPKQVVQQTRTYVFRIMEEEKKISLYQTQNRIQNS